MREIAELYRGLIYIIAICFGLMFVIGVFGLIKVSNEWRPDTIDYAFPIAFITSSLFGIVAIGPAAILFCILDELRGEKEDLNQTSKVSKEIKHIQSATMKTTNLPASRETKKAKQKSTKKKNLKSVDRPQNTSKTKTLEAASKELGNDANDTLKRMKAIQSKLEGN